MANELQRAAGRAYGKHLWRQMCQTLDPGLMQLLAEEIVAMPGEPEDGPLPGNRFRFAGQIHEMRPVPWELLKTMWGHQERNMHDVEDDVWGVGGGSQLGDAKHDLKTFLEGIGYPFYVSKARRSDSLVWKAF